MCTSYSWGATSSVFSEGHSWELAQNIWELFTFVSDMDKMWFSKWLKKEISVCKPFYSIQRRKIWWLLQEKLCTHMYSNEGKADCKSRSVWYKAKAFMTNCKEVVKCTPSGKDYGPETTKSWTAMRTWPCLTSKVFFAEIFNWSTVRKKLNTWTIGLLWVFASLQKFGKEQQKDCAVKKNFTTTVASLII